jgi:signal transduction histidine kinase
VPPTRLVKPDERVLDWTVALALLVIGLLEAAFAPAVTLRWGQAALTVLWTVPLGLRKRWPIPVLALVVVLGPTYNLVNSQGGIVSYVLAALLASFTVGRHLDTPATWWGPALAVGFFWVLSIVRGMMLTDFVYTALLYGGAWAVGYAFRRREMRVVELSAEAEFLRQRQAEREERAVAQERTRIARELHDIVSHSLSVITIQTQAVRRRLEGSQQGGEHASEVEDLRAVEATSRQAMSEMRRLLGVLRADDDDSPALAPQPGLEQLPTLIDETRGAGLPVSLSVDGEPRPLPPGVDLAVYRIVQEALTNVRKHTTGSTADVTVRYGTDAVDLEVKNDGTAVVALANQNGHGLIGMRERVSLYGGTVLAEAPDSGGYVIRAHLPLRQGGS